MNRVPVALVLFLAAWIVNPAFAAPPWSWDKDQDNIDDHITRVETYGVGAAHEDGNGGGRLMIDVTETGSGIVYGVYIRYAEAPTEQNEATLEALGLKTHRYRYINYIRSRATYEQIQTILHLPGVVRVESLPLLYPVNDNATKSMGATDSNDRFPSLAHLGFTGKGVVIGILDSGVNDAPDSVTGYPGHESLIGKFLGGGNFSNPDASLNTPIDGSENPVDRSPEPPPHGTHVAGTAMGTGGPTGLTTGTFGFYRGMAPDARLVDCKVLTDAGVGGGAPDALEWCIYHKDWDWGLTGADSVYQGIQVVNMSIGGLMSNSDGTDASSAAVNAAVKAGIVCCVSSGNDGETSFISSPGAADLALTIGASVDANTVDNADNIVADFSNEGPRLSDADADSTDEMKPNVCPPGAGITSANGGLTTGGNTYATINGTSMSAPMATGLCALIVEACPGITPQEVKRILQDTAEHRKDNGKQGPGAFPGYQSIDPNYHPSWGWGFPDAYAAVLESRFPNRTQVVRESGEAVVGGIDIHWTTQRELFLYGFHILRADPIYGSPGAFQQITTGLISPTGSPYIHKTSNRTEYVYHDTDPSLVPGETYWYRVRWLDGSQRLHDEPAFPVVYDPPTPVATLEWSITHNTPDNDLLVFLGSGTDVSDPVNTAPYFLPAPGAGAGDSSVSIPGEATTGNIQHFWHLTLTDRDLGAEQFLPPGPENPWFLWVNEAGFVNRAGKVNYFRIIHHAPGGDVTYTCPQPITPTVETQTTVFWIPQNPVSNPNHAPVLSPVGSKEALEGRPLEFMVSATDPDGDALIYTAPELPPGAAFDPESRTLTWTPDYSAVSSTTLFTATFHVEDDDLLLPASDEEQIEIRLHDIDPNGDLPPYWTAIDDFSVFGGRSLSFKTVAVDPEGGTLTYSASGLPSGATFDPLAHCFVWDTDPSDAGVYTVSFMVNDGTHADVSEEVVITVKAGVAPLLGSCESEVSEFPGTSSVGFDDLGTADRDTIEFTLPRQTVRLSASLSWAGAPVIDLDYFLEDENGNQLNSGASLNQPESILIDNLPPGTYRFVVVGFTVPSETDWTLTADACLAPVPSAVEEPERTRPYALLQNSPNPFGASTRIAFRLQEPSRVKLNIYDIRGALVRSLLDNHLQPGPHSVSWDGRAWKGNRAAAGVYFYRLEVPGRYMETRRMLLIR